MIYVVVIAAVLVIVALALTVRSRRSRDTVDSFRRGLDALSPEARRPVVDQVQRVNRPEDEAPDQAERADADEDEPDDPGGARGT